jgi:transposase
MAKPQRTNAGIRYSEAFKMQIVREVELEGVACDHVRRKYSIRGTATVPSWVRKYGNGSWGRRIRVETPEEINHTEQLKRRVRALERALADANIELVLERQFTRIACERAGIRDVVEFKKKAGGQPPTAP